MNPSGKCVVPFCLISSKQGMKNKHVFFTQSTQSRMIKIRSEITFWKSVSFSHSAGERYPFLRTLLKLIETRPHTIRLAMTFLKKICIACATLRVRDVSKKARVS